MPYLEIRTEAFADLDAIRAVVKDAFPTPVEAQLVDRLRDDGSIFLSLVALSDGAVVGHVVFSRMRAPAGALGLGPVAVSSSHRRIGIAAQLIEAGLARAKAEGWKSVFVLGNPAYYTRFGFRPELAAGFLSPYAGPHLMGLELQPGALAVRAGELRYPEAFSDLD